MNFTYISEAISHISERHFILFPISWLTFLIIGRALIRNRRGKSSNQIDSIGTNIFLLTFITACSLIQLVTFELSGSAPLDEDINFSLGLFGNLKYFISYLYLHPQLRKIAWNITLYILCLLLNFVIPILMSIIIARKNRHSSILVCVLNCIILYFLYQTFLWSLGLVFPLNATKIGYQEQIYPTLMTFTFHRSLQQSVAYLAAIGTTISAVINGFASVNFPFEQLMIVSGVDEQILHMKEKSLRNILSVGKKKNTY